MVLRPLALALLVLGAAGCVSSSYLPHVQPNRAALVMRQSALYFFVHQPRIKAISFKPPFACDEATRRLALDGPGPLAEPPEPIERFYGLDTIYGTGVFAVATVDGPELEPGPDVLVLSGDESDHPAIVLLNVIDRYNDVAECLERRP